MENTEYKFEEKLIVSELIKDASPAIREALRMQIRMIARKIIEPKLTPEEINLMDVSKFYDLQAKFSDQYNIKSEWDFLGKK
ncbi:MAG: hypothetical protein [Lokiarchaeia virus VerdaV1]|uniref:Uncharacterized protein n=1 Tax=Lokiarchaeia virus VerdaV1 TaxID=3070170 RepID=A0AA35G9V4_9CAUD|nr:MAG: hypothetical protein QIT41_gp12 [Lokiarchaeia virus VerdaV1]BDI54861.1 MAG: hypothetical protein [Lokiarchaeia virus VerdaV1]